MLGHYWLDSVPSPSVLFFRFFIFIGVLCVCVDACRGQKEGAGVPDGCGMPAVASGN